MKLISIGFLLVLVIMGCAKVPSPSSDLAKKIVQLMDKYLPELGLTIVTDEICNIATERSLQKASDELRELNPKTWIAGVGHPMAPTGSFRAEFSRDAQFLRNQYLLIYVSDEHQYCEAKIENVPGL